MATGVRGCLQTPFSEKRAPRPDNESARLAALYRCSILDTAPEETFDGIVELAAKICGSSHAALTFVDENRVWSKAVKSADSQFRPGTIAADRDLSLCSYAIMSAGETVVVDARLDSRFVDNPFVTSGSIIFYGGVPIHSSDAFPVGALCVWSSEPRELSPQALEGLKTLSRQIESLLQLRIKSEELRQSEERLQQLRDTLRKVRQERDGLKAEQDEEEARPFAKAAEDGEIRSPDERRRKLAPDQLTAILRQHALWLLERPGGVRANLSHTDLSGHVLNAVDLSMARLVDCDLTGAFAVGANFFGADFGYSDMTGIQLEGASMSAASMLCVRLRNADLTSTDMMGAKLHGADLSDAKCRGTILALADLSQSCCIGTDFTAANLEMANLTAARLDSSIFLGAAMKSANMDRASIANLELLASEAPPPKVRRKAKKATRRKATRRRRS